MFNANRSFNDVFLLTSTIGYCGALVTLCCWQPTYTPLDIRTTPPVHNQAEESAEHLVLHSPVHEQARRETSTNLQYQSDPRHIWSFLERIRVVTHPKSRNERQTVTAKNKQIAPAAIDYINSTLLHRHLSTSLNTPTPITVGYYVSAPYMCCNFPNISISEIFSS